MNGTFPPAAVAVPTHAAARLHGVRQRIERACAAAQRDPGSVRLLAVGKTFGPDALAALIEAGQYSFGENYLQEALHKIQVLGGRSAGAGSQALPFPVDGIEWHFIGPIQSNKTRPIATHFDWVHSIDRVKIAARLSEQRPAHLPALQLCLQVNLDQEPTKSGLLREAVIEAAAAVVALPRIRLRGLMAIPAPRAGDPAGQMAVLLQLQETLLALRTALPEHADGFDTLSMGMSDDLEAAIAAGSTLVRIGSALMGPRPAAASSNPTPSP